MRSPTRRRFAEVVRARPMDLGLACLLVGGEVDATIDVDGGLAALDRLARRASGPVDRARSPVDVGAALSEVLGVREGFRGADDVGLHASLLHEVLRRRRGAPLLLTVVWLEVTRRLGVPSYGVGLPGRFVVGLGDPARWHMLLDPAEGGARLRPEQVDEIVRESGVDLRPEHLRAWQPHDMLLRLLEDIREWAARPDRVRARLWATELALLLPHHPAGLRRERGELLAQVGDFHGGAVELVTYADAVEPVDPAEAETARRAARRILAHLN